MKIYHRNLFLHAMVAPNMYIISRFQQHGPTITVTIIHMGLIRIRVFLTLPLFYASWIIPYFICTSSIKMFSYKSPYAVYWEQPVILSSNFNCLIKTIVFSSSISTIFKLYLLTFQRGFSHQSFKLTNLSIFFSTALLSAYTRVFGIRTCFQKFNPCLWIKWNKEN